MSSFSAECKLKILLNLGRKKKNKMDVILTTAPLPAIKLIFLDLLALLKHLLKGMRAPQGKVVKNPL